MNPRESQKFEGINAENAGIPFKNADFKGLPRKRGKGLFGTSFAHNSVKSCPKVTPYHPKSFPMGKHFRNSAIFQ
jgi:hypothetical protein